MKLSTKNIAAVLSIAAAFLFVYILPLSFTVYIYAYSENASAESAKGYAKALKTARRHAHQTPGKFDEAYRFGALVHEMIAAGLAGTRIELNKDTLVDEALYYLDSAAAKTKKKHDLSVLYMLKYELLLDTGSKPEAIKSLKTSIEIYPGGPALRPLLEALVKSGRRVNIPIWCRYERSRISSYDDLRILCKICSQYGDRLDWLPDKDRADLGYPLKNPRPAKAVLKPR